MTIEEVMSLIQTRGHGFRTNWATDEELRAALTALVAQARDEEAWACASVVHSAMTCVMTCDASGHPATEYINRAQTVTDIRARIAARAQVEPECEMCEGKGTIDERLTGWSDDNPKAKCPDCDGAGWIAVASPQEPTP